MFSHYEMCRILVFRQRGYSQYTLHRTRQKYCEHYLTPKYGFYHWEMVEYEVFQEINWNMFNLMLTQSLSHPINNSLNREKKCDRNFSFSSNLGTWIKTTINSAYVLPFVTIVFKTLHTVFHFKDTYCISPWRL